MSVTEKRMTVSLTKEDLRELKALAEFFNETPSLVIKRALIMLYHKTIKESG